MDFPHRTHSRLNSVTSRFSRSTFASVRETLDTFDSALEATEFGRFQVALLLVCGLLYSLGTLVPSLLTYETAAIECELQLLLWHKKTINDITYGGMLSGTLLWAILGDLWGRRGPLLVAMLVNSAATLGLALSRNFLLFSIFKFLSSASLSGTLLVIVFLAEYQQPRHRGSAIACLQIFWVLSTVALPVQGLPWRLAAGMGAVPPLLCAGYLLLLSDTPRFLLTRGDFPAAMECLEYIYSTNTGLRPERYPVRCLRDNESLLELQEKEFLESIPESMTPRRYCLPFVMSMLFTLFFSYYSLALWFPDLSSRHEFLLGVVRYVLPAPPNCELGDYAPSAAQHSGLVLTASDFPRAERDPCAEGTESGRDHPFSRMQLVAFSCLPSCIWLILGLDALGRKFFIAVSHVLIACLVFCSYFVIYTPRDLMFSCVLEAACSLSVASCHCLAVELSSTRWRCSAVALVVGAGQLGAVLGNAAVALTMTGSCAYLVSMLAIAIAGTGMLSIALPDTAGASLR